MCGRYYIDDETSREIRKLLEQLDAKFQGRKSKRGDIAPTNYAPVIIGSNNKIEPDLFSWGFPNFKSSGVIINARSETAFEKKMFRESLTSRRCIIPANGFFEWNKNKEKNYFTQPDSDILYMAGIYNTFKEESKFVILTTSANPSMVEVHNRMPLILQKEQITSWLFENDKISTILKQVPIALERKVEYEQTKLDFI